MGLTEICLKYRTNKCRYHSYTDVYDELFCDFIVETAASGRTITLLEIGVLNGGSLKMWQEYLRVGSTVIGMDHKPGCKQHEDVDKDIYVYVGSQDSGKDLNQLVADFAPFDIIIDDGSHRSSSQKKSFTHLWDSVRSGGFYCIEDLFWQSKNPDYYIDDGVSTIDFMANLARNMQVGRNSIRSITIFQSLIIVQKK